MSRRHCLQQVLRLGYHLEPKRAFEIHLKNVAGNSQLHFWGAFMPDEMNEILQRLTRVETKLDIMNSARDIALEATQSCKSAHLRIDEIRDEMARLAVKQAEGQRWLIGTIISSAGLFIAAVGLLLKVMLG